MASTENQLLSIKETRAVEAVAFAGGTESYALMRRAGYAVAEAAMMRYPACDFLVLAGPGNNGGDGFVAARELLECGMNVTVALMGKREALKGDAARAAADYKGKAVELAAMAPSGNPVIIDALFGIGLNRKITGEAAKLIRDINTRRMNVVAVDIPSGVNGDSGESMGVALRADFTITFIRRKYGHLLMPGRELCGEVILADLGVSEEDVAKAGAKIVENVPQLWHALLPWPQASQHKYQRGHTLVIGGQAKRAGAAKLAALAALRMGSGLVSIVAQKKDIPVYAKSALSLMTEERSDYKKLLADERKNTVLIGPGAGVGKATRDAVLAALKAGKQMVLDADALTSFASSPQTLFKAIKSPAILTPHGGEFAKLFPKLTGSKLEKTLAAAKAASAVVIYKGYDTVIASPDGRAAINSNAPPTLATAGSGDVLAGICAGLLAQDMPMFEAACAAVWIHGEAARQQGVGLISQDLPERLPLVLQALKMGA